LPSAHFVASRPTPAAGCVKAIFEKKICSVLTATLLLIWIDPTSASSGRRSPTPTPTPSGPPAPVLAAPANGASLVQPITLDWDPVSASGGPIGSYTWQVGTTNTFTTVIASGFPRFYHYRCPEVRNVIRLARAIQSWADKSMLRSHRQNIGHDGFALSRFQTSTMRHATDNTRPFVGPVTPRRWQRVAFDAPVNEKRATFA
jgi:hypothetical protein